MDYKIKVTKNYNAFELSPKNRLVVEKHVEKLVKIIKKNGYKMQSPIWVSDMGKGKYMIIDGQHRFLAAQKIGCEFSFIVFEDYEVEGFTKSLIDINDASLKWSILDFLRVSEDENKKTLVKIIDENPICLRAFIIAYFGIYGKKDMRQTKEFNVDEMYQAISIHSSFLKLQKIHAKVAVPVIRFLLKNKIDTQRLFKNIDKQPMKFVNCATSKQFADMIEYFYNYDYPKANRVKFDI